MEKMCRRIECMEIELNDYRNTGTTIGKVKEFKEEEHQKIKQEQGEFKFKAEELKKRLDEEKEKLLLLKDRIQAETTAEAERDQATKQLKKKGEENHEQSNRVTDK